MHVTRLTLIAGFAIAMAGCASSEAPDSQAVATSSAADATSATSSSSAATAAISTASAPGPRIRECRYAKTTGTKMRYRICHSPDEWAAIDAASAREQNTDDFFRTVGEQAATGAGGVSASPR